MKKMTCMHLLATLLYRNQWFSKCLSDVTYIKILYRGYMGKKLDLKNPTSFSEKIQWLKLNDKKEIYSKFVDKYEVKELMKSIVGEEHIIPTIGIYTRWEDIDTVQLPNRFVIKCTHDSGSVVICKDKTNFNFQEAKKRIEKSLSKDFFYAGREWPYKGMEKRIIIEDLLHDKQGNIPNDYKVFVFNGVAQYIQLDYDRFSDHKRNIYDRQWNIMPFTIGYNSEWKEYKRPNNLELMLTLSEKIAQKAQCPAILRVDFYEVDNRLYFGEVTFYHGSGFKKFEPEKYDLI